MLTGGRRLMMSGRLVIVLLIVNVLMTIVITNFTFRKDQTLALLRFVLSFFIPGVGILLCMIMRIRHNNSCFEMAASGKIKKYKLKNMEFMDEKQLQNMVPANDALGMSDEKERRKYMLGLLKQEEMSSLRGTLKKALSNEDSEVSHYAASGLMELQRESYAVMTDREMVYREGETNTYGKAIDYAASILAYLKNSEIGQLESYTFRRRYEEVMKGILSDFPKECISEDYENLIDILLKQSRLEEAGIYAKEYNKAFCNNENSYLYCMKVSYQQNSKEGFQKALSELRNSSITISSDTLSLVRFWAEV